ncbi:MAG: S8 family serine peptidase, partial [Cyanobacteria bacterium P01_D01_bin.50]
GYDDKFNGTSASTANVSGVASLVWSVNSDLSAGQIKTIISQTAYDLGKEGYDKVYGHGFINADAAVRRALAIGRGIA